MYERQMQIMKRSLLEVGTLIVTLKRVGAVNEGHVGIITGIRAERFLFWSRPMYVCTFVGSIKAVMKPNEVVVFDRVSNSSDSRL